MIMNLVGHRKFCKDYLNIHDEVTADARFTVQSGKQGGADDSGLEKRIREADPVVRDRKVRGSRTVNGVRGEAEITDEHLKVRSRRIASRANADKQGESYGSGSEEDGDLDPDVDGMSASAPPTNTYEPIGTTVADGASKTSRPSSNISASGASSATSRKTTSSKGIGFSAKDAKKKSEAKDMEAANDDTASILGEVSFDDIDGDTSTLRLFFFEGEKEGVNTTSSTVLSWFAGGHCLIKSVSSLRFDPDKMTLTCPQPILPTPFTNGRVWSTLVAVLKPGTDTN